MKAFLAIALFNLIAFAQCKGVEKTTEFGVKGDNDIHLYSEFFSVYRPSIDRYQYISFPPAGLINYYNITYVRVNDYNPSLAYVKKVDGDIGSGEITISIKAPVLRRIEATVDIFGTFVGPCFNKDNKKDNHKDTDHKDADNKDAENNDDDDNKDADNKDADNKDADNKDAEKEANKNPVFDIDIRAGMGEENNQVAPNTAA